MKINGSQIIVECLVEQGVDTIFGFPGGAVLNIYDALYQNKDRIRHILTCHEQNAAHAADGYARSTGKVGVAISTSGPGATNLVTGIASAYMDSTPVVFITGNVGTKLIGKDSFQEIDICGVTMPITKHNFQVHNIEKLADTIREAFYIARSGRPGPVLVDIPKDITAQLCEFKNKPVKPTVKISKLYDTEKMDDIVRIISNSKKPFIISGGGVILGDASKELKEFADLLDCPVAATLMGLGSYPETDSKSMGMVGMHGTIASNKAVIECDCLIAIGVRFSDRVVTSTKKFAQNAKIIHIDIDISEIGKNLLPYYGVVSDSKAALKYLIANVKKCVDHSEWISYLIEQKNKYVNFINSTELNPKFIMEEIKRLAKDDAIITTEVGQHQIWASQYYKFDKPRTLITSGGLGTMGFGTGAAIGAQIANPNKRVFAMAGDGSFRMNLIELATIKEYDLPIIIVLFDNETLGMVRQWQTMFYQKRYSHTDLKRGPEFSTLAKAYGLNYYEAKTQAEFAEAIKKAYAKNEPTLIQAHIGIDEKVFPMVPAGDAIDHIIIE